MGDTSIEWATKTWGVVLGCKRVSSGCDHCYAISTAHRWAHSPNDKVRALYEGLTVHPEGERVDWTGVVRTVPARLVEPFSWPGPERVFVNSQSDLFHPAVPVEFIVQVFAVMALTPHHTYQVLTKRPDVAIKVLTAPAFTARVADAAHLIANGETFELKRRAGTVAAGAHAAWEPAGPGLSTRRLPWPLPNVWLGTSVEDQAAADERIPKLLRVPAAVRWISAEPLLGPVNLDCWFGDLPEDDDGAPYLGGLDWVVAGGESGPGARPAHPDWFRSLRDQCAEAGVPFLLKQAGSVLAREWGGKGKGSDPAGWPEPFPREYPDAS